MTKREKSERTQVDSSAEPDGEPGWKSVRVAKILDLERDRELDHDHVGAIAESAQIIGFLHPIAVRKAQVTKKSKVQTKTVLVAGAHRLEAARYLGHERIECRYIRGDDETFVRLVQIGEDLFRKHLTVLRQSELVVSWYELASRADISGQLGQKNSRGRPSGGDSKAARDLPIGRSIEARRKIIQRAKRIARIQPEAKQAAINAGLDDNQRALLSIAAKSGRKAQLRKVMALTKAHEDKRDAAVKIGSDRATAAQQSHSQNRSMPYSRPDTTFEQLEELWQQHVRKSWMYAPFSVRERFIGMLQRARNKASADVVGLVQDVFAGREKVYVRDLLALGKSRGFSKSAIRKVLKHLCYPRRRSGHGPSGRWYYRNVNSDWKEELRIISDSELRADSDQVEA